MIQSHTDKLQEVAMEMESDETLVLDRSSSLSVAARDRRQR